MNLTDKTFLISGGASGLGGATADELIANGARVVLIDLNREAGEKKAAGLGDAARFVAADVCDEQQVGQAVSTALDAFGALHGVINCAGIVPVAKLLDREGRPHDLGLFEKGIRVNLVGTFNVTRLAAAEIVKNLPDANGERGVVINTASVAAYDGQIGQLSYAASKGGVVGMTLPMARELARYGVRVMTIAPGIFDTPMMAGLPDAARESLGAQVPFPSRLGKPAEYALMARQIIENPMLNGEVIRLDGAIRMAPR
ncbi:SDR family NAD(P)-dependent oxidoreductase [Granulosicoccaceae sp. 1_MG-2023]|nr:SDR family NAD(P)-dependent oxidoreductase [Granulosicoccaceae sp. 1_MG-2023]